MEPSSTSFWLCEPHDWIQRVNLSVQGIHHTSRTVSDLDRSIPFYRDLLGMELVLDTEMKGEMLEREVALPSAHLRLALLQGNETPFLELLQYLSPPGAPLPSSAGCADIGAHHVALVVPDISTAFDE